MLRMTPQRAAIFALMREETAFVSAQDLHDRLAETGVKIGLATVYRNLQAMVESGEVDALRPEGSETQLFRYCSEDGHHHHLVCRQCGRTEEVGGNVVEKWAEKVGADAGFTDVSHSVELFGTCATCAKSSAS